MASDRAKIISLSELTPELQQEVIDKTTTAIALMVKGLSIMVPTPLLLTGLAETYANYSQQAIQQALRDGGEEGALHVLGLLSHLHQELTTAYNAIAESARKVGASTKN